MPTLADLQALRGTSDSAPTSDTALANEGGKKPTFADLQALREKNPAPQKENVNALDSMNGETASGVISGVADTTKQRAAKYEALAPAGAMALAPIKLGAEKYARDLLIKQRRLPDVDYKSGTDFSDRMSLTMMDNDAERKAYLSDRYGEKNVAQDPAGTFYVTKGGKKIVPSGGGMLEVKIPRFPLIVPEEGA